MEFEASQLEDFETKYIIQLTLYAESVSSKVI